MEGARTTASSLYECSGYRLPTFAEWEYAARSGTLSAYHGGEIPPTTTISDCLDVPTLSDTAWYCWNSGGHTHPVGQKTSNSWGLHDVLGNAAEWINESPFGVSPEGPLTDPGAELVESPMSRVRRGCPYNDGLVGCRVANRYFTRPTGRAPRSRRSSRENAPRLISFALALGRSSRNPLRAHRLVAPLREHRAGRRRVIARGRFGAGATMQEADAGTGEGSDSGDADGGTGVDGLAGTLSVDPPGAFDGGACESYPAPLFRPECPDTPNQGAP